MWMVQTPESRTFNRLLTEGFLSAGRWVAEFGLSGAVASRSRELQSPSPQPTAFARNESLQCSFRSGSANHNIHTSRYNSYCPLRKLIARSTCSCRYPYKSTYDASPSFGKIRVSYLLFVTVVCEFSKLTSFTRFAPHVDIGVHDQARKEIATSTIGPRRDRGVNRHPSRRENLHGQKDLKEKI